MARTCPDGCCNVPDPSGVTDAMIEDAECRGLDAGIAAGSWVTDGNTTAARYRYLRSPGLLPIGSRPVGWGCSSREQLQAHAVGTPEAVAPSVQCRERSRS